MSNSLSEQQSSSANDDRYKDDRNSDGEEYEDEESR